MTFLSFSFSLHAYCLCAMCDDLSSVLSLSLFLSFSLSLSLSQTGLSPLFWILLSWIFFHARDEHTTFSLNDGELYVLFSLLGGTQQEFFFAGIDGVKFRRPVVPGDQLVMKVVLTKLNKRFGIAKMKGQAFVGEELACEAELTLALGN